MIIKYVTAPANGPESDVEYDSYGAAHVIAHRDGHQLIARYYVFSDSELLADFTRYHWLVTARLDGNDEYWHGPDRCHDSPAQAQVDLTKRLTRALRNLDGCEDGPHRICAGLCDSCRAYVSLSKAVRELNDVDPGDIEKDGYACTVTVADPDEPVVYRITRIVSTECDDTNHREG